MTPGGHGDRRPHRGHAIAAPSSTHAGSSRQIPILQLAKIEIPRICHTRSKSPNYGVNAKPRMLLPDPKTPQVKLEYAEKAFPQLPSLEEENP